WRSRTGDGAGGDLLAQLTAVVGSDVAREACAPVLEEVLRGRQASFEHTCTGANGEPLEVCARRLNAGGAGMTVVSVRPVREADGAYRRLFDHAPDIIFSLDREARVAALNREGYRVTGYTPGEVLGQPIAKFVAPEHLPRAASALQTIWAGGSVPRLELELVFKDGRRGWFEMRGYTVVEDGQVVGTTHIARDITERRALAEARELLSQAAAAAPIVIWAVDMEGRYTLLEGGALAEYGLRAGELVGQSIFEFQAERPEIIEQVRRGLAGEAFSALGRWQDTTWEARYVPLRDAGGRQVGLMAVVLDITERMRTAEAQARADKMEALSILAGGVAHDFNNLLVGVLGNASLALLELEQGHPARPAVAEIEAAARRLADLTRQMLAFSGRGQFVRGELDINAVAQAAIRGRQRQRGVRVRLIPGQGLPLVIGDAGQLRLAIAALVENAVEASPEGGRVTVTTRAVEATAAEFARAQPIRPATGRYVVVEVTDAGEGIAPELLERIFEPFFTTRFTGRGLGLPAAAGVARGHGGCIVAESAPGRGSRFRLYLPAAAADSPS
ncbi:PAS domain-containing protein, partial [Tepidiforma sp.]|uniref:PAS domain-containing sensor histidine kinase n=1 Tax=Tepidiforma sp. TaxID=2682230 RepID=UPI002ADD8341